jgi:hypothetical protein
MRETDIYVGLHIIIYDRFPSNLNSVFKLPIDLHLSCLQIAHYSSDLAFHAFLESNGCSWSFACLRELKGWYRGWYS